MHVKECLELFDELAEFPFVEVAEEDERFFGVSDDFDLCAAAFA